MKSQFATVLQLGAANERAGKGQDEGDIGRRQRGRERGEQGRQEKAKGKGDTMGGWRGHHHELAAVRERQWPTPLPTAVRAADYQQLPPVGGQQ